jgi:hypothetical protein
VLFLPSIHRKMPMWSMGGGKRRERKKKYEQALGKKKTRIDIVGIFHYDPIFPWNETSGRRERKERMEEMMMNINFDDGTQRGAQKKDQRKEEKSKQVIITHPNLFHCPSHLGLIKGDENWSYNHSSVRRAFREGSTRQTNIGCRQESEQSASDCEGEVEKKRLQRKWKWHWSIFNAIIVGLDPTPRRNKGIETHQKRSFIATFHLFILPSTTLLIHMMWGRVYNAIFSHYYHQFFPVMLSVPRIEMYIC